MLEKLEKAGPAVKAVMVEKAQLAQVALLAEKAELAVTAAMAVKAVTEVESDLLDMDYIYLAKDLELLVIYTIRLII